LTYNLRLGTSPGAADVINPMSRPDGRRLLPQAGNMGHRTFGNFLPLAGQTYYWSVQAVDNGFVGSPFSAEQSFIIPNAPFLTGDANGDGLVDQSELNATLHNYWQISPPGMQSVISPSDTRFRFDLETLSSLNFHVLATTNVALPLMDWTDIGPATLRYEFTDPDATNYPARFYRLIWP
jgi:hypothetical protein